MIDTRLIMTRLAESTMMESQVTNPSNKGMTEPEEDDGLVAPNGKVKASVKTTENVFDEAYDDYVGELAYECPDCGETFASDFGLVECVCPECDKIVRPLFLGEIEDVEEESEDMTEAVVKVVGGKIVKLAKQAKAGFKRVNGKYVKMSQKEIRARKKSIKKAGKKAHTGTADVRRSKSLRKRQAVLSNMELETSEMVDVLNQAVSEVYQGHGILPVFESVDEVSISVDGSKLELDCSLVKNGVTESVLVSVNIEDGIVECSVFEGFEAVMEFTDIDNLVLVPESVSVRMLARKR